MIKPTLSLTEEIDVKRRFCLQGSRRHGLMRKDYFLDMESGLGEMWAQIWRCLNCGSVHDAVFVQNRLAGEHNDITTIGRGPRFRLAGLRGRVRP